MEILEFTSKEAAAPSMSEPILRAKIENMISPDYVLCYIPRAMAIPDKK